MLHEAGATKVLGVDNDSGTIETARETFGHVDGIEFELADAVEFLDRRDLDEWDVVVVFEGLEHLADPEPALRAWGRHCEAGRKCAISVPNSRMDVENPYHLSAFDHAQATAAFRRLSSNFTVLYQFDAEASLIRGAEPGELKGRFVLSDRGEPELCSNFIGLINFDDARVESARMQLEVAPVHRRYLRDLERKNDELWRDSTELAERYQELVGKYEQAVEDQGRAESLAAQRQAALESVEASLSWRITSPIRAAKSKPTAPHHPSSPAPRLASAPRAKRGADASDPGLGGAKRGRYPPAERILDPLEGAAVLLQARGECLESVVRLAGP